MEPWNQFFKSFSFFPAFIWNFVCNFIAVPESSNVCTLVKLIRRCAFNFHLSRTWVWYPSWNKTSSNYFNFLSVFQDREKSSERKETDKRMCWSFQIDVLKYLIWHTKSQTRLKIIKTHILFDPCKHSCMQLPSVPSTVTDLLHYAGKSGTEAKLSFTKLAIQNPQILWKFGTASPINTA